MNKHLTKFVGAFLSAALLAACGANNGLSSSTPMSAAPPLASQSSRSLPASGRSGASRRVRKTSVTETVLHSFAGGSDGQQPQARLTNVNGALYGTTYYGGTAGAGTVFEITHSGTETVLHSFAGGTAGANPSAGLTNVNGTLYGTTYYGGPPYLSYGTVFSITPSGTFTVLHVFAAGADGAHPYAGLTNVNGILYGTTEVGGAHGSGTIFSITTTGTFTYRVAYSFAGATDGRVPDGDLTNINGTLYGTTYQGGSSGDGTVFSFTPSGSGTYTVLHAFAGGTDGEWPVAGLTNVNGTLYGTTLYGGTSGDGTIFNVTTSGTESVLHSFAGGADGANPYVPLTYVSGTLYGTTYGGGSSSHGTVFNVTTSGTEAVLYSFAGGTDGANPYAGLTNVNGTLYGTTYYGGNSGDGTVFKISFPVGVTETVLHSFSGSPDGSAPYGAIIKVGSTLYGTTRSGGAYYNAGTVFSVTSSGVETVLHNFANYSDGSLPYAGLLNVKGRFYGTTSSGGAYDRGTIFSVTPSGTETVLHSFNNSGGVGPYAQLINVPKRGVVSLDGTTSAGGVYNQGMVFSITLSGTETVLHSFGGGSGYDGTTPLGELRNVSGTLYGTTSAGGAYGYGSVFAISKSGKETVLHSFGGGSGYDGTTPQYGKLVTLNTTLYGTTVGGGTYGYGTIFSITPSGTYTVLHSFNNGQDGAAPYAGLVIRAGTLYGTTSSGGTYGAGTLYSITPAGTYTVLWAFGGNPDGQDPRGDLVNVNGTLYGTTTRGGSYGNGTVFSLSF